MAEATFVHGGGDTAIDYTAVGAVVAGEVVVAGDMIAVARRPIAAAALGALHLGGVYDFAIATGGTVATGADIYWLAATNLASSTASGSKYIGKTVSAKASGETVIRARLTQSEDPNDA